MSNEVDNFSRKRRKDKLVVGAGISFALLATSAVVAFNNAPEVKPLQVPHVGSTVQLIADPDIANPGENAYILKLAEHSSRLLTSKDELLVADIAEDGDTLSVLVRISNSQFARIDVDTEDIKVND